MEFNFEPLPKDMQRRYLDRRTQDARECMNKLPLMDWDFFERLGHQLRGNAPAYGYSDLGLIAAKMEVYAKKRDYLRLQKALQDFMIWLKAKKKNFS